MILLGPVPCQGCGIWVGWTGDRWVFYPLWVGRRGATHHCPARPRDRERRARRWFLDHRGRED